MDDQEYLAARLEDQILWYDKKSSQAQKRFKILKITEIILAATIPTLSGFTFFSNESRLWVTAILGALIAILAGIIATCKFQEIWITYRTTAESLKHQKYLYITKTYPYDCHNPFPTLVKTIESLISKENTDWGKVNLKSCSNKEDKEND